jgi:hypothetical protein
MFAMVPAGLVPVTPSVRIRQRDDDYVARARPDLLVAAGADVGLGCSVGLDTAYLRCR